MLTDGQIERYSRQILLPEVGGIGQERLLAARVAVDGHGPAAAMAATLLGRAGVGTLHASPRLGPLSQPSPDCRLSRGTDPVETDAVVWVDDDSDPDESEGIWGLLVQGEGPVVHGTLVGTRITVATMVGRPCWGCLPSHPRWPGPFVVDVRSSGTVAAPARLALGALAASEALRVLLAPPRRGRLTSVDFGDGAAAAADLEPTDGCAVCGARA